MLQADSIVMTHVDITENKPISDINIIERPKNQTAHVGDTVVFMCRSDTWPAPSVHWARKPANKLVVEIVQVMQVSVLTGVLLCYRRRYGQRYCGDCIGNGVSVLTGVLLCYRRRYRQRYCRDCTGNAGVRPHRCAVVLPSSL